MIVPSNTTIYGDTTSFLNDVKLIKVETNYVC